MGKRGNGFAGQCAYPQWLVGGDLSCVSGKRIHTRLELNSVQHMRNLEPIAVMIDGIFYASMKAAAAALGIGVRKVEIMVWSECHD